MRRPSDRRLGGFLGVASLLVARYAVESPAFLLSVGKHDAAAKALGRIGVRRLPGSAHAVSPG